MTQLTSRLKLERVKPAIGVEGGLMSADISGYDPESWQITQLQLNQTDVRLAFGHQRRLGFRVPAGGSPGNLQLYSGRTASNPLWLPVAEKVSEELHAVSNPAIDRAGQIFTTISGRRGEPADVSVIVINPLTGSARPFASGIVNPTGLAFGPDGTLYVTGRHEGRAYAIDSGGGVSVVGSGLGVPTGILVSGAGELIVGDRDGHLLRFFPGRPPVRFVQLPRSAAAYHLTWISPETLAVACPTLTSEDALYLIDLTQQRAHPLFSGFGRPQGILGLPQQKGVLVSASYRGNNGIFYFPLLSGQPRQVIAADGIVGLAASPEGDVYLVAPMAIYRVKAVDINQAINFISGEE